MSYQIIPNIIFIVSLLGIILIILKQLPEASKSLENFTPELEANEKLQEKGLPAQAVSKVKVKMTLFTKKVWNFVLEAKDLKPHALAGYKMKKIFGGRLPAFKKPKAFEAPKVLNEVRDESYYLDVIKLEPKNLSHYDALGKFYLEQKKLDDAKDIYLYLANHQPANADFQAKLAYSYYQVKEFAKAAEAYQKSLDLDSTQPNRYYNLGLSLEALGQHDEARKNMAKALELEPENPKYQNGIKKIKHT